jgi:hypothetical protein
VDANAKDTRSPLWLAAAIIAFGALLRLGYLTAPHIDSDQAIFGLEGIHVLKGEFPIFSWGYAYIGTLQSYLDAGLFALFGPSRHMLNLAALPFYLLYGVALYALARRLFPHTGWALAALALGAVAPAFLMVHGIWGRHGYPETVAFGTLMLALMARNLAPDDPPSMVVDAGLYFVAGVAWWSNFLILALAVPFGAYTLYRLATSDSMQNRLAILSVAIVGFGLGSFPFWYHNLQHDFESLALFGQPGKPAELILMDLKTLVTDGIPILIGAQNYGRAPHLPTLAPAMAMLFTALIGLFVLWAGSLTAIHFLRCRLTPLGLVWMAVVNIFGVYLLSGYSATLEPTLIRYLLPFYCVYPLLPIFLLVQVGGHRAGRFAAVILLASLLALNVASYAADCPLFHREMRDQYAAERQEAERLAAALDRRGIETVLMYDYWKAPRMTFDVAERVVFAFVNSRYPEYLYELFGKNRIHYLTRHRDPGLENGLALLGYVHRADPLDGYTLYHGIAPDIGGRGVGERALSSLAVWRQSPGVALPELTDSNGETYWRMRQSNCLDLRLESSANLRGVLILTAYRVNAPQKLTIIDGATGEVLTAVDNFYPGYRVGGHPYLPFSPGQFECRFATRKTDRLQLCVQRAVPAGWFAIAEVMVLEAVPDDPQSTPPALERFVREHLGGVERVYASPAFVSRFRQIDGSGDREIWGQSTADTRIRFDRANLMVFERAYLAHNRKMLTMWGIDHHLARGTIWAAIATRPSGHAMHAYWCVGRLLLTGKAPVGR